MTLTNAELLAFAMPIAGALIAFVVGHATLVSIRRDRRVRDEARRNAVAQAGDDDLLEIAPELMLRAAGGDRPRYFVRAGALKALVTRGDVRPRSHAAE
jgi:hypothetical protein